MRLDSAAFFLKSLDGIGGDPVLLPFAKPLQQHVDISSWPGRLTNLFEPLFQLSWLVLHQGTESPHGSHGSSTTDSKLVDMFRVVRMLLGSQRQEFSDSGKPLRQ